MKLTSVEFRGYRRLRDASCNVDGKTIAFIGPNESGKSSVLMGLEWLTNDSAEPLPPNDHNRDAPPLPTEGVVRARFRLDEDDIQAVLALGLKTEPPISLDTLKTFSFSRTKAGTLRKGINAGIHRSPKLFDGAAGPVAALLASKAKLAEFLDDEGVQRATDALKSLQSELGKPDGEWTEARLARLESGSIVLSDVARIVREGDGAASKRQALSSRIDRAALRVDEAKEAAEQEHPEVAIRDFLYGRSPKFVLFRDGDRILERTYHLGDESVRNAPPAPLTNLFEAAGSSVEEVWAAIDGGTSATMRTLEKRMNKAFMERVSPMWRQSDLTIELTMNQGGVVEVNIDDIGAPAVTPIDERSDGLRAFLALVCFLLSREGDQQPILMIDEAERNLHMDAQADLVRVLTRDLAVPKVIYTTHSPGCLPLDLGRGIRIAAKDPKDPAASILENNFWTATDPGFSRLLFAMGAEAAAFSAFRRAVLAEGVSEMLMLPTLFRNATEQKELDFQIAFGLSNMAVPRDVGNVALNTVFLVDGDKAGNKKKAALIKAGFPSSHVLQLPAGKAVEDLIDRKLYLDEVDRYTKEVFGVDLERPKLATNVTIAKAVDDWSLSHPSIGAKVGHKVISSRLADLGEDLALTAVGKRELAKLRARIEEAFEAPYELITADADYLDED